VAVPDLYEKVETLLKQEELLPPDLTEEFFCGDWKDFRKLPFYILLRYFSGCSILIEILDYFFFLH